MRPQHLVNRSGYWLLFVGALSFVVALPIDLAAQPKEKNLPPIHIDDPVELLVVHFLQVVVRQTFF